MVSIPNISLPVLGKKIAFSTIVQYAGELVQIVLSAVLVKIITNFFLHNPGDYGIYQKILEFSLFFGVIANLGIFGNVVRRMADEPLNGKIFFNSLALRIISSLLFFALGILFLVISGHGSIFIFGSLLYGTVLFFDAVSSVCKGMLQANYLAGRATVAIVVGKIIYFGGVVFLVKSGMVTPTLFSALGFLAMAVIGTAITLGLSLFFVKQKIQWQWHIDKNFMKEVLWQGLPFGLISVINSLYFRFIPDYFASEFLTDGQFASFGIFFRAAQVASLFSTFLMFSVLPGFKEYIDGKHWQKVAVLYKRVKFILVIFGVLLFILGTFVGPILIELLSHKNYFLPELWFALPCMLLLAAISYGYDLVLITLFAFEKEGWLLKRELIALLIGCVFFALAIFAFRDMANREYFSEPPGVFWPSLTEWPVFFVLLGSIAAESFIVIVGLRKVKKLLASVQAS